jgi:PAS domain S-box-containing protein
MMQPDANFEMLVDKQRLLDSAIDHIDNMIIVIEAQLAPPGPRILYVNHRFTEVTGYAAAEVVGQTPRILQGPKSDHTVLDQIHDRLTNQQFLQGESINYRKDGSEYIVEWIVTPIHGTDGNVAQWVLIQRDVTAQREEANRRRQGYEILQTIVDHIPVMIAFYDADNRLVFVNHEWERVLGWSLHEVNDQDLLTLFYPDPELRTEVRAFLVSRLQGWRDFPVTTRDGRVVNTTWSTIWLSNGTCITIGQDITARKQAEANREQLLATEQQARAEAETMRREFETILERVTDSFVALDNDWRYTFVNQKAAQSFNRQPEDMIGKHIWTEFPEGIGQPFYHAYYRAAAEQVPLQIEEYYVPYDRWFENRIYPSSDGLSIFFQDITDRKRAEQQRLELERKLLEAQKLESLGVLAGGIAHDFNNLLVAILGNANLALLDLEKDSSIREQLQDIETAARRAADLTHQMLAYAGKGRFVVEHVNINLLLAEMVHLLNVAVPKHIPLETAFYPQLPQVEADPTQLRQVLMNLIINAAEAIGNQSGRISVRTRVINAHVDYFADAVIGTDNPAGIYVAVDVEDTGRGMDEATRSKIFEPFFTTKFTGRGLGLAAVLGIVRRHHGAIKVDSQLSKGTTFTVLLPVAAQTVEQPIAPESSTEQWHDSGTVLVIDDDSEVRGLLKRLLEHIGFETIIVDNGAEAIELFRTDAAHIRYVLLDLTMPHMDGETVFRALRQVSLGVPIILMSGYSADDVLARFAGSELSGFLQKPFTLSDLQRQLQQARSAT